MADPLSLTQSIIDGAREVFGWWTDEGGRIEARKRSALRAKNKEFQYAARNARTADDFAVVKRLADELERLSNAA